MLNIFLKSLNQFTLRLAMYESTFSPRCDMETLYLRGHLGTGD